MNKTVKARNRILSLALALCLLLTMTLYLPGPVEALAAEAEIPVPPLDALTDGMGNTTDKWSVTASGSHKELRLYGPGPYVLTGTANNLRVYADAPSVAIILRNVHITQAGILDDISPLDCNGNQVRLTLEGSNALKVDGLNRAAVRVLNGASLTIAGGGELTTAAGGTVVSGTAIHVDADSALTVTGGAQVGAKGGSSSAGIGTNNGASGSVTITGNAVVTATGGSRGAGIGGGNGGNGGSVTITGNARVYAKGGIPSDSIKAADIGAGANATDGGTLRVGGGAYLELQDLGTNVNRAAGSLEIGECTIVDTDSESRGDLSGTYHWLLVEGGTLGPTTVEDFWLTDGTRQIIRAGASVTVDADPGFARWYTSDNILQANPTLDSAVDPAVFIMPAGTAWIATTNLAKPLSVTPGILSLDLDDNRTGTVTLDMGINDGDGLSPLATQVTAVSSDPAIAEVEYGPHTSDVTVTAKRPGDAIVTFTFNDPTPTTLSVVVNVAGSTKPGPSVSTTSLELVAGETDTFFVSLGDGYNAAESATITSDKPGVATVAPPALGQSGDVVVTGIAKGSATISIGYSGGARHGETDTVQVTVTGSRSRSTSRSSGGSSTPDGDVQTRIPASAFSWDGRTLTIDHGNLGPQSLRNVLWDGAEIQDYSAYKGSVILRFDEEFIAAQASGDHTVRVEFGSQYGETTVTVGETGSSGGSGGAWDDNDTHNPDTGGYPGSGMNTTDNPNTGDGGGIWPALLLGSLGAAALVRYRGERKQH